MAETGTPPRQALAPVPPRVEPALTGKPPHPLDAQWFMNSEGETYGPYSGHALRQFAGEGRLTPETEVIRDGAGTWTTAAEDTALRRLFPDLPALRPQGAVAGTSGSAGDHGTVVQITNTVSTPRPAAAILEPGANKSPGLALLLSLVIVGLGQIYNGETAKGIMMFLGCLLLWALLLGWVIHIWAMVDAYSRAKTLRSQYELWQLAQVAAR
ncbi:DUF4339 domain-containing protein [Roseivivax sp.]